MLYWDKIGKIFDPSCSGLKWMREYAQLPYPFLYNNNTVRVYFATRPQRGSNLQYISRSGYIDIDRSDLTQIVNIGKKPIFDLGNPGSFDEFGCMTSSIIQHKKIIYAYYTGWSRLATVPYTMAIGLAISQDNGLSFKKISEGPILGQTIDEPFLLSGPKVLIIDGLWHMWYLVGVKWLSYDTKFEPVYKIAHATSFDGIKWSRNGIPILPSIYENECQVSFSVFKYHNKWNAIFAYRQPLDFRKTKSNTYRLGYAWSDDLITWHRDDKQLEIDLPEDGWDSEMMAYPQVSEIDGEIYLFYCGNNFGQKGFGIAKLIK